NDNPSNLRRTLLSISGPTSILVEVNYEASVVIKADAEDARSMNKHGVVIVVTPQLALYDTGAVFRLYVEFRDQAHNPMAMESFLNPAQAHDLALIRHLSNATTLDFYL